MRELPHLMLFPRSGKARSLNNFIWRPGCPGFHLQWFIVHFKFGGEPVCSKVEKTRVILIIGMVENFLETAVCVRAVEKILDLAILFLRLQRRGQ